MKNKLYKYLFLTLFVLILLVVPNQRVYALEINYPCIPSFGGQSTPGCSNGWTTINPYPLGCTGNACQFNPGFIDFLRYFIQFAVIIGGLLTVISLVIAGFRYVLATANPEGVNDAKDRIKSALLGLVILLASYIILNTINPGLLFTDSNPPPAPSGSTNSSQLGRSCNSEASDRFSLGDGLYIYCGNDGVYGGVEASCDSDQQCFGGLVCTLTDVDPDNSTYESSCEKPNSAPQTLPTTTPHAGGPTTSVNSHAATTPSLDILGTPCSAGASHDLGIGVSVYCGSNGKFGGTGALCQLVINSTGNIQCTISLFCIPNNNSVRTGNGNCQPMPT